MYFAEFSPQLVLKQVILGARYNSPTDELIQLVRRCSRATKVIKARLASRTFRVVRDREVRFVV